MKTKTNFVVYLNKNNKIYDITKQVTTLSIDIISNDIINSVITVYTIHHFIKLPVIYTKINSENITLILDGNFLIDYLFEELIK